jgi:hypothetical protein
MLERYSKPGREDDTDVYIKQAINISADVLHEIKRCTDGDATLSLLALAISVCVLAKIDGTSFEDLLTLIKSAHNDLEVYDGDHQPKH